MNNELLPCPFCGKSNTLFINYENEYYSVICDFRKDGCGAESGFRETEKEVLELWNTRVVPSNEPLTLEQLKERVGKPVYHDTGRSWRIIEYVDVEENIIVFTDGEELEIDDVYDVFYDHEPKD